MANVYNSIAQYNPFKNIDLNQLIVNSIFAIAIIIFGIFLGKIVTIGLKRLSEKLELNKKIRGSFIDLFMVIIRWSIYLIFISFGLNQLNIPSLTNFFTSVLITIPALAGALILIIMGFTIAYYLREAIKNSEIKGGELISQVIFYFILYIFGVYALKTSLISLNEETTNWIIIILTAIMSAAIAFVFVKKELKSSK